MSIKKFLYAIFFSSDGKAIHVPVLKRKRVTGLYYHDVILKKLKKYIGNDIQWQEFNIFVYCMIMPPARTSENGKTISKVREGSQLATTTVISRSSPLRLIPFFAGYISRQALWSAVSQCLRGIPKSAYRDTFWKWIYRLKSHISNHSLRFEGMLS